MLFLFPFQLNCFEISFLLIGLSLIGEVCSNRADGNFEKNRKSRFSETRVAASICSLMNEKERHLLTINIHSREKDNEIIELKARVKKSYETKYNNGVATMTELLNKTNAFLSSNISYLQQDT